MLNVYYVSSGMDACYYVRCLLPLLANGWSGDRTNMIDPIRNTQSRIKLINQADVVVFHRPTDKPRLEMIKRLKLLGKKVVVDNDDTYKKDNGGFVQELLKQQYGVSDAIKYMSDNLHNAMKEAHLITASTEYLANELKQYGEVKVIKNGVYPPHWREPLRNQGSIVRIGIVGSATLGKDPLIISNLLEKLSKNERVQLVMFGIPPNSKHHKIVKQVQEKTSKFYSNLNIEWQPLVQIYDYPSTLNELRLDLMLIPRAENEFNKAKSNLKFLEASMCEIPIIASGFTDGPYQNDKFIELCYNIEEWNDKVENFITNTELRRSVGKKAKEYVLENYDVRSFNYKELYE